jgi:hypothetical protein
MTTFASLLTRNVFVREKLYSYKQTVLIINKMVADQMKVSLVSSCLNDLRLDRMSISSSETVPMDSK